MSKFGSWEYTCDRRMVGYKMQTASDTKRHGMVAHEVTNGGRSRSALIDYHRLSVIRNNIRIAMQLYDLLDPLDGLFGAARLTPAGSPCGRSPSALRAAVVEPVLFDVGGSNGRV
jgi:hypothetical protein